MNRYMTNVIRTRIREDGIKENTRGTMDHVGKVKDRHKQYRNGKRKELKSGV